MSFTKPTVNDRLRAALEVSHGHNKNHEARILVLEGMVQGLIEHLGLKPVFPTEEPPKPEEPKEEASNDGN